METTTSNSIGEVSTNPAVHLSVVIVSWNVAELLESCIQSIVRNVADLRFEVIVVDNFSKDHTSQMLRDKFPWVKVIANQENVGFARANNQGFHEAQGKYILILNPDTILVNGALKKMVEFLDQSPTVGLAGPKLCFPNGEVQDCCARLLPTLRWVFFCDALELSQIAVGRALVFGKVFLSIQLYYYSKSRGIIGSGHVGPR